MTTKISYSAAREHQIQLRDWFDYRGYLEIWENGEVRLLRRRITDGTPRRAYHLIDVEFEFSGPSIKSIRSFVNSAEIQELFKRLSDGHSIEWDGHNHEGVFTDDAKEAMNRIYTEIYQYQKRSYGF